MKRDKMSKNKIWIPIIIFALILLTILITPQTKDKIAVLTAAGLIITLAYNVLTMHQSNVIQQDALLHDMVKFEIENWKYIHEQKKYYDQKKIKIPQSVRNHILNYYEYLAYLILRNKIDEECAKDLWRPNILGEYKDFKADFISGDRKELKKLYEKWSKE